MFLRYRGAILLILFGVINGASAVLAGIIPSELPEEWGPYLWISWPLFILFTFAGIVLAIIQVKKPDSEIEKFDEKQNQRNREIMLQRVENDWIHGVLKKSLYSEVRMELGLELHPEVVENPWNTVLQMPHKAPVPIPANKKIIDVFNECSKSVVIVGEPGSGKTTELLELASQAIESAKDPGQPIPVVFILSTWTSKLTLKEWIVDELSKRYKVSPGLGNYWVNKNELLLLLDGLDEVKSELRNQCVKAINEFIKDNVVPVAVCCRKNEFEMLATRIDVCGAIIIQPLDSGQVEEYLNLADPGLVHVYNEIKVNSEENDLNFIHTPLFLSILILAYRGVSVDDISKFLKSGNYKNNLFDYYILQMFARRGESKIFKKEQTIKGLSWLAGRMIENGLSIFYIENIQIGWLENNQWRRSFLTLRTYPKIRQRRM